MLSTDSWRHRPRRSRHSALLILVLTGGLTTAYAQEGFDCRVSLNNGKEKYDLTSLAGEHSISRERVTPPTRFVDTVHFDLCSDLPIHDGVDKNDQVFLDYLGRECIALTFLYLFHYITPIFENSVHLEQELV